MWKAISYDNSYFDKVIEMSIENFGTENDICDRAFLKHQYFDNPAGNALIELAIDSENGTLAGQYVVTPARFRCFGKDVKCVTSLNTLTRKEYRGQKIFVGLADLTYKRAAQEGYSFCYGAPNQNSYHGFIAKLNFQNICETPLYLRPINPASMIRERTNSSVLATLAKQFSVFFPCKDGESKNIVELDESNYQLMNAFWEKVKDYYPVMGIRDAAYIHYRYMNVPRRIYYPYIAIERGQAVAFAVGRIREVSHFNCGMIADFLYVKGYEEQAKALIKTVVRRMKDEGASLAGSIILSHTKEAKMLTHCGFFKCPRRLMPQPTPLILRVFDAEMKNSEIRDINNWFFTTGDYDVV